jgi:hypothetical protein
VNEESLNETARLFSNLRAQFPFLEGTALTQLMLASSIGQAASALSDFKWNELETCLRKALFGEDAHYDSSVANIDISINIHSLPQVRMDAPSNPISVTVYNGEREKAEAAKAAEERARQAKRDEDVPF